MSPLAFSPQLNRTMLLTPSGGVFDSKENAVAGARRSPSVLAHHPIRLREEKQSHLPEQVSTASTVLNDKPDVDPSAETPAQQTHSPSSEAERVEEPRSEAEASSTTSQAKGESPSSPLGKRGKTSNRYSHQSKVKAHIGACVLGSITLGILAGPLGAVFALGYVNAMSRAIHGGTAFPAGHQEKTDKQPPTPEEAESGSGENDDQPRANGDTFGSNNIIYAPVINIDNSVTLNGNVYFFGDNEYHLGTSKGPTTSSKWSQTESNVNAHLARNTARETDTTSDHRGDNVSEQTGVAREQQGALVDVEVTNVQMVSPQAVPQMVRGNAAGVFAQSEEPLAHVTFSDGMSALLQAPSDVLQQLLHSVDAQLMQEAEFNEQDTEVASHQSRQQHTLVDMASHRGEGFRPLVEKSLDASQASVISQHHEGEAAPTLGPQGTHTWVKQPNGGAWSLQPKEQEDELASHQSRQQHTLVDMASHRGEGFRPLVEKSLDASQASVISQHHEGEAAPTLGPQGTHTWVKQPNGGAWSLQPKEQEDGVSLRHVTEGDLAHEWRDAISIEERVEIPLGSHSSIDERMKKEVALTGSATDVPVTLPNPSALWLKTVKNGKVSWSKPGSSADQTVLLTEGSVSGRAKNYNVGPFYNVKPLGELRTEKYTELQGKMTAHNHYVLLGSIPTRPLNLDNFVITAGLKHK